MRLLQLGQDINILTRELAILKQLDDLGLPTVNARHIEVYGKLGILMDRFELGSKDIVRTINKKPKIIVTSPLLNKRSIQDLENIRKVLRQKKVQVKDLQFLIGKDGGIVIADPVEIHTRTKPSNKSLATIERLIEAARKNL